MRVARIGLAAVLAARVTAQGNGTIFEPQNFNVTAALQDIGVNISTLPDSEPETYDFSKRSLFAPCLLAVSLAHYMKPSTSGALIINSVYFVDDSLRPRAGLGCWRIDI